MTEAEIENKVAALEATGRFKVLRRVDLGPISTLADIQDARTAIVVDTETTGLDRSRDEIIEIGMIAFSYDGNGTITHILDTFSALQQPQSSIPPVVQNLTGITDELVRGHSIDKAKLEAFVGKASLIVAHNAAFDRPMCEKLSSIFADKPWACSATEIDWRGLGFEGTKLAYILTQFGKFHESHRALDDCVALVSILREAVSVSDRSIFSLLLESARKTRFKISLPGAPSVRMAIRNRGYRWQPANSRRLGFWWKEFSEGDEKAEVSYLSARGVSPQMISTQQLTAFNRYKLA